MNYVFISYVHENEEDILRLRDDLTEHRVKVWLDREDILPGMRWKQAIRGAIHYGAFFIACFSKEYNDRDRTFMHEELELAIAELRQRPKARVWFIPVKLNECELPDHDIGSGESLQDLHYVELYKDWNNAIRRILLVIQPDSSLPTPNRAGNLGENIPQKLEGIRHKMAGFRAVREEGRLGYTVSKHLASLASSIGHLLYDEVSMLNSQEIQELESYLNELMEFNPALRAFRRHG